MVPETGTTVPGKASRQRFWLPVRGGIGEVVSSPKVKCANRGLNGRVSVREATECIPDAEGRLVEHGQGVAL